MKNSIFLSYSPPDAKWARELAGVLKKKGMEVWHIDDTMPGRNWWKDIGAALSRADAMVVLISPDAVESSSVQRDIDFALSERRFKNRLIPVVVRPTKHIPWILQKQHLIIAEPRKRPAAFREVAATLLATVG